MSSQPPSVPALPDGGRRGWYQSLEAGINENSGLIGTVIVVLGFCWRLWLAHATFFNTDEAWHYSVANQHSLLAAYKASLTLAHPPLMIFVLYFWRHLGTSDVMLRLPGVLAGTGFCWIFYRWLTLLFGRTVALCGLVFTAFLPPMIALSAELRQYSWMLFFAAAAAYLLERALARNSSVLMLCSSVCLWLSMLSHYSAFLFAASMGLYVVLRIIWQRPSTPVIASSVIVSWGFGQAVGAALGAFLYITQVAKLGAVYPGDPLRRFGDFYLADVYFHSAKDHLLPFLYRGTFGVFRFICGQRTAGHLTTVLFLAGIVLLFRQKSDQGPIRRQVAALLLTLPFLVNWVAVLAGLYPYGRTRQCIFLAIFGLAGVSICLARIARHRTGLTIFLAAGIVAICHIFGTPHTQDMLAFAEQRHEHMDQAIAFIENRVSPTDVLFTDKPTSFQLTHYLCGSSPASIEQKAGFDSFSCRGLRVIATNLSDGSLTPQTFPGKLREMHSAYNLSPATGVWVVQAAWSSGLGETLRTRPDFSAIEPHVFDRYIEIFQMPPQPSPTPSAPAS